ncbi:MAG: PrgI family protein [Clostridia bacterium]|nr:PrgI family protein [Clostridia bacterium]
MGTYNIPRNVKGEGRILFIFSMKALMYSGIGAIIGLLFYFILDALGLKMVGIVIIAVLALIGFIIGTFKFPEFSGLKFTKVVGGEEIDDVIKRAVMFKKKGNKIYVYTKEEKKNG